MSGTPLDRFGALRVVRTMTGAAPIGLAGALALLGCQGSLSERGTTPPPQDRTAPTRPEDVGPRGAGDVPAEEPPEAGRAGADAGGGAGSGGGPGGTGSGEAGIQPPGVDLAPAEKERRVSAHLEKARAAMDGDPADPDKAIHEARAALGVDEGSLEAMLVLAHANYAKGYHDKAEAVLEIAEKRGGGAEDARFHFLYGLVYDTTDRGEEAMAAYESAVELDPDYESALMNLGVHYLDNRRFQDAIDLYEDLTGDLGYQEPEAWTNLGSAYRGHSLAFSGADGDPERYDELILRAKSAYSKALELDSNYAPAYYNLGILYLDAEPFPIQGGDLESLARLKRAKKYLDQYRGMPEANVERADEQAKVASEMIRREERRQELRRRREERRKKREQRRQRQQAGGN